MFFAFFTPVLAVDFGTLISIVFLVIAFLSWIMNIVNGNQKPAQNAPRRRPPRPRDDRMQNEIDVFLQEVTGKRKEEPAPIEMVEEDQGGQQAQRKRPVAQPRPRREGLQAEKPGPPRREAFSSQAPSSQSRPKRSPRPSAQEQKRPWESSLRQEQKQPFAEQLERQNEKKLQEHLEARLREGQVDTITPQEPGYESHQEESAPPVNRDSIVELLQNPQKIRQAVLVNEILSRPRALRRR